MQWLDHIQWHRDLGVELNMLNNLYPPNRNTWYFDVLKNIVPGKDCLEIGFGTGCLSMIALAAGARHITAWESDYHRFLLGQYIIKTLGVDDQIELHYGQYNSTMQPGEDVVVFHEIIGPNIWREGLRSSLPLGSNLIVPGEYSVSFEIIRIPGQQFKEKFFPPRQFTPQVAINQEFIELLNNLIVQSPKLVFDREWYTQQGFDVVGEIDFYNINVNMLRNISKSFTANINVPLDSNDRFILYPKCKIRHDDSELFWSYYDPLLVPERTNKVIVTQDFDTGEFHITV